MGSNPTLSAIGLCTSSEITQASSNVRPSVAARDSSTSHGTSATKPNGQNAPPWAYAANISAPAARASPVTTSGEAGRKNTGVSAARSRWLPRGAVP